MFELVQKLGPGTPLVFEWLPHFKAEVVTVNDNWLSFESVRHSCTMRTLSGFD